MTDCEILERTSLYGRTFWQVKFGRYISAPTRYRQEAEMWAASVARHGLSTSARFLPHGDNE